MLEICQRFGGVHNLLRHFFYLQDRGVGRDFRNDGTCCQSTRCHFPEDRNPNSYHCENIKFNVGFFFWGGGGGSEYSFSAY